MNTHNIVISIVSLVISIIIAIYNIVMGTLNYKRENKAKVKILFEKQWEYDEYKNIVESRYADYNIIMTNESKYRLYDFSSKYYFLDKDGKIQNIGNLYKIGFMTYNIETFVPGQIYKSNFGNFTKLKNQGIRKIEFVIKYKIRNRSKKYKEEIYCVDIIPLADVSEFRHIRGKD
ncbi:hypothetical protein [Clostridium tyrobutyricum]|uniref:hypothetical protein n=1 Tax=Clostridium tyrobutyricum TaxID=1519 RepID=UPI00030926A6|nr:hypothetical protein [Clostridium tyrobutyricum]MEA5009952.1 hypothetical protein [Clostridium tyrobutyricum]